MALYQIDSVIIDSVKVKQVPHAEEQKVKADTHKQTIADSIKPARQAKTKTVFKDTIASEKDAGKGSIKLLQPIYKINEAVAAQEDTALSGLFAKPTTVFILNSTNRFQKHAKHNKILINHTQQPYNVKLQASQGKVAHDWAFLVLLVSLGLILLVVNQFKRTLQAFKNGITNYLLSLKLFKAAGSVKQQFSVLLNINYLIMTSLFLYKLNSAYDVVSIPKSPFIAWGLILMFVFGFRLAHLAAYKIMGQIVLEREAFNEYIFHTFTYYKLLGIILVPLNFFIFYMYAIPHVVWFYTGMLMAATLGLARFIRGFQILGKKHILNVYKIMYFCILEILPILLLIKYVNGLT
ncbi:MAG: DUF4271 domain-containing protein [Bacteroidales bacterium]|nr:DUF4271 domain-containing protein [Bacteroidales bacterium]